MPPASLGGSLRSSGSDPGSFKITASDLVLGLLEILHASFKNKVSFLLPSSLPVYKLHWPSKSDVLGAHLSNAASHPGLGNLMWGLVPSLLGEDLYKFSHLWVTHLGMWVSTILCLCPPTPPMSLVVEYVFC